MICPKCHSQVRDGSKFCTECGAALTDGAARRRSEGKLLANTGVVLGQTARQARLEAIYEPEEIIGVRAYNAILLGVLLWGLLVNMILCALVGDLYWTVNPIVFLVLYLVLVFGGISLTARSRNPWLSFLGYNMVVLPFGLVISGLVSSYGGIGSQVVRDAFLYTLLISLGMMAVVMIRPQLFEKLGGALFGFLIGLVICEVVLLLLRVDQVVTDWVAAGLFSLYIGYDIYRSQRFAKTVDNAVDCALDIYLDVANLFVRLLEIMNRREK